MKQRWKKIASLMLVTICAFSLTACGKKEETAAYQQITDDMVSNCAEVSQSAVESLAGFEDDCKQRHIYQTCSISMDGPGKRTW